MNLYKINFLCFMRNKFCKICYILANLGMMGYNTYYLILWAVKKSHISSVSGQEKVLLFSSIMFVVFMFLSYFFYSDAKKNELLESISATEIGKSSYNFNQFSVLLTLAGITTVIATALSLLIPLTQGITDKKLLLYCLAICFVYFFLADITAIMIGLLCSKIKKETISYVIMIISAVLFSPLTSRIPMTIYMITDKNTFSVFEIFDIYPRSFNITNEAYGYAINSHSITTTLIWLFAIAAIVFFTSSFRTKYVKIISTVLCVCVASASFVGYAVPYSDIPHNLNPKKGINADTNYYCQTKTENIPMQYNEKNSFSVTSYDMKYSFGRELNAVVHMNVDKRNLDEYKFTLYHGYSIINIADSYGNKMKYDRNGDYITVYRNEKETDNITISYYGTSAMFYANYHNAYLPAGFAYYPISGFHYMFDIVQQGIMKTKLDKAVPIKVTVDAKEEIHSNLRKVGKNSFEGLADGVTLVGGFYKEATVDGTRVIYTAYDDENINDKNIKSTIKEILSKKPQYKGKTIIVTPKSYSNVEDFRKFELSDHILTDNIYSVTGNPMYSNETKVKHLDLYYAFMRYYDKNSELYKLVHSGNVQTDKNSNDLNTILAQKIIEYGDDNIYTEVYNVVGIYSNNDTTVNLAKAIGEDSEE